MKSKNQQPQTSEKEAKERLIIYVYEYLIHCGATKAADLLKAHVGHNANITVKEGPGFLVDWWCVFWDLYCAAPDRRGMMPEASMEARAFHEYRGTPMSPITHPSSPQHLSQGPSHGQHFMSGPRVGYTPSGPHGGSNPRGPPPRMQVGPGPPPHGGAPTGFMTAASPRYSQHPSGPIPGPHGSHHMQQGPGGPFAPDPMGGPSPGMSRMTPVGCPPPQQNQQVVGGPPPPQCIPGQGHQMMGGPQGGMMGSQINQMQVPPRNGSQGSSQGSAGTSGPGNGGGGNGWQGNINYTNVNSPAQQQISYNPNGPGSNQPGPPISMMSDVGIMDVKNSPVGGGEPSTPHGGDELFSVGGFQQDPEDESADIMKMAKTMKDDPSKMYEKEQAEFGMADPFPDAQWK